VDDALTFGEFLSGVRRTVLDAFAHQDVPFERVVDALQPERDTSRNPLFDVIVLLQNTPSEIPDLSGLVVDEVQLPIVTASHDLTFEFEESGERLRGAVEYNTDLFDAATIERMTGHLLMLLSVIADGPDRMLGELPLLTAPERQRVLVQWNDTALEVPESTFPELFAAQAARTPEAIALVFCEDRLSFAELDARANRLAHHLIAHGAGPETLVALMLPRTTSMIVRCSACSRPARPTCRSTRPSRPTASTWMLSDARPVLVLDAPAGAGPATPTTNRPSRCGRRVRRM
jgi:non-ribosomal peptide synthetase component F